MSYIYFPSCKFTAQSPETSNKMSKYLKMKFDMEIAGCCRTGRKLLTNADTAICLLFPYGNFLKRMILFHFPITMI